MCCSSRAERSSAAASSAAPQSSAPSSQSVAGLGGGGGAAAAGIDDFETADLHCARNTRQLRLVSDIDHRDGAHTIPVAPGMPLMCRRRCRASCRAGSRLPEPKSVFISQFLLQSITIQTCMMNDMAEVHMRHAAAGRSTPGMRDWRALRMERGEQQQQTGIPPSTSVVWSTGRPFTASSTVPTTISDLTVMSTSSLGQSRSAHALVVGIHRNYGRSP